MRILYHLSLAVPLAVAAAVAGAPVPDLPPRTDAVGDPLPEGAVARLGTLRQRSYYTYDVRFRPDGKTIETITGMRSWFCEWDPATGALQQMRPVKQDVQAIAYFSPNLSFYVVHPDRGRVRLVETLSGKTVREYDMPADTFNHVQAFSPDSKRFAVSSTRENPGVGVHYSLAVYQVGGDRVCLVEGLPGQINHVRFSSDGDRLLVACMCFNKPGELSCWDVATGKRLWAVARAGTEFATTTFAPDGKRFAIRLAVPFGEHVVELWDAATGKRVAEWHRTEGNAELKGFAPDGKLCLVADGKGLHAIEVASGKVVYSIPEGGHGPAAFAPDGKSFVTTTPVLRRWDAATGKPLWEDTAHRGHTSPGIGLAFSPDGKALASLDSDRQRLFLWDVARARPALLSAGKYYPPMGFAHDGKTLFVVDAASHGSTVVGLSPETGKETTRLSTGGLFEARLSASVGSLRPTADRLTATVYLAEDDIGEGEGTVIWDLTTRKPVTHGMLEGDLVGHGVLSPDGRTFACRDRVVDPQKKSSKDLELDAREDAGASRFSPDGKFVAGPICRRTAQREYTRKDAVALGVWETATGRRTARLPVKDFEDFALTKDAATVVVLHADRLAVWDVAAGKEVLAHRPSKSDGPWASPFAVSPDGSLAATTHPLGTILLWDVKPPRPGGK